jgi:GNAT superfamily N-acetyltransferase
MAILIREAVEQDAAAIGAIFHEVYGEDYPYLEYYEETQLKKLIFSDDTIMVVAEDTKQKHICGTASIILQKGAYSDLVGEFGRLVVAKHAQNQGVGKKLMQARLERVQDRLHVAVVEPRLNFNYSCKISDRFGFSVVGYQPSKYQFDQRENLGLMVQYFGQALHLRRNHPRILPEAAKIAHFALTGCELKNDTIIDDHAAPYPHNNDFKLEELNTEGYADILRIERGRLQNREIFGPYRLHYGFFKLRAENSRYLIAKHKGQRVGALGFTVDSVDKILKIFELIQSDEAVIRFLFEQLLQQCGKDDEIQYVEVDVNAHSPRMQRTLLELGFLPVAYIPAYVFQDVERLDIVRMARVFSPIAKQENALIPPVVEMEDAVRKLHCARFIQPRILEAIDQLGLFDALVEEQRMRVASYFAVSTYEQDEYIFKESEQPHSIAIVLEGEIDIFMQGKEAAICTIQTGECVGEISSLTAKPHSASAKAKSKVVIGEIKIADLRELIRLRPDIGVVIFENFARELGQKLKRTDIEHLRSS